MADYWTWLQLKTKIKNDTDTQSETFVSAEELLGYANEAVDDIEKAIHNLNEDYFLSNAVLSVTSGQASYPFPANIYAMKIRGIVYRKGTDVFTIKRLRDWHKLENHEIDNTNTNTTDYYRYIINNSVPGQPQIVVTPPPKVTGPYLNIWYIRNANKLIDDTSICDIPEAANYIIKYVSQKIYAKELNPMAQTVAQELLAEREKLTTSLAEKTPDNETEVEPDFGYYNDMIGGFNGG